MASSFPAPPAGQYFIESYAGADDSVDDELGELFARAGCRGYLCVLEVEGDGVVSSGADDLVVTASVCKVPIALEVFTQVAAGRLDPRERVRMSPTQLTPGSSGFSIFSDEAEVSIRDLTTMMLTVSDNAAADVLIGRVGLANIHATLGSLGLRQTVVRALVREDLDSIGQDGGFQGWAEMQRALPTFSEEKKCLVQRRVLQARALDPRQTNRTTAREMATLLRLVWRDEAGTSAVCAPMRRTMARQVTRQRLALGFSCHEVKVAAKSGTLLGIIRNDVGVIAMPDGRRYAAAIFTCARRRWDNEHEINAAIGAAAACAVKRLRCG